ncbi:hypothetical protein HELRODRAFT_160750 [Helobdella robusta]|uniref:Apple domain-containing protein n=1 Tax=Helobdella robusta TaxID=6412 RepID=T1EQP0_HELRO|nr:hypothetical protein HELRODRAFT_160750 [Helobdella robusta]ESO06568.1 hypothetical protein HELRODRAFT_160750 [Helobdella robusta]
MAYKLAPLLKEPVLFQISAMLSSFYFVALIFSMMPDAGVRAKCFEVFEMESRSYCTCAEPFKSTMISAVASYRQALLLCSMRCSQLGNCMAFNFWDSSNFCQLFNQTTKSLSMISNCKHYLNAEVHESRLSYNKTLNITVDNELIEFYVNGVSVPTRLYFPNADDWSKADTYNIQGYIHVLAIKSLNSGGTENITGTESDAG